MNNMILVGQTIKKQRLLLNLRMDDVAKKAKITRATLWSMEKGTCNYSIHALMNVLTVLGLSLNIVGSEATLNNNRSRATRKNTLDDKRINRFVVMCVEQYANYTNLSGKEAYELMKQNDVIDDLINDYEDLHGMSTPYLNDYIHLLIGGKNK